MLSKTIVCDSKKHILHGRNELLRTASSCCIIICFKLILMCSLYHMDTKKNFLTNLVTEQWLACFVSYKEDILKMHSEKFMKKKILKKVRMYTTRK